MSMDGGGVWIHGTDWGDLGGRGPSMHRYARMHAILCTAQPPPPPPHTHTHPPLPLPDPLSLPNLQAGSASALFVDEPTKSGLCSIAKKGEGLVAGQSCTQSLAFVCMTTAVGE